MSGSDGPMEMATDRRWGRLDKTDLLTPEADEADKIDKAPRKEATEQDFFTKVCREGNAGSINADARNGDCGEAALDGCADAPD